VTYSTPVQYTFLTSINVVAFGATGYTAGDCGAVVNAIPGATFYIFVGGIGGGRQDSIAFVRFGGYNGSVVLMELVGKERRTYVRLPIKLAESQ